jgi:hypothetical protein
MHTAETLVPGRSHFDFQIVCLALANVVENFWVP